MLPKIAVAVIPERKVFLSQLGLTENSIMGFEGEGAKVSDLRPWLYEGVNIAYSRPGLSLVIWNADKLSPECQAVLLKPIEELDSKTQLFLVVENENQLMPTILSRCVIDFIEEKKLPTDIYWAEIRKCWSSGPSACIAFTDQMDKETAVPLMEEIIEKLRNGLSSQVNEKRLKILDQALSTLAELKQTNINYKLSLDNFLVGSWRLIKSEG